MTKMILSIWGTAQCTAYSVKQFRLVLPPASLLRAIALSLKLSSDLMVYLMISNLWFDMTQYLLLAGIRDTRPECLHMEYGIIKPSPYLLYSVYRSSTWKLENWSEIQISDLGSLFSDLIISSPCFSGSDSDTRTVISALENCIFGTVQRQHPGPIV
jgi:hypothetical protein